MTSVVTGRVGTAGAVGAAPSGRGALAGLSVAVLLASLGTSVANVALPTLARAFGATFQRVQWVVLAYLLAVTTLVVGVGRLGDVVGRRRLLLVGVGLFTGASVVCGAAPGLEVLVAGRAVQGVGAAVMMAMAMALVGESVPRERIGRAMGLLGAMSAVGTALGPSLGGVLIAWVGWRGIFAVNVPLGVVTLWMARRHLAEDRPVRTDARVVFDGVGTLVLGLTLASYALAVTVGRGRFGAVNAGLLVGAVVGVGLFLFVEGRAASPLVRVGMFRDGGLGASLAVSSLVSTVMMGMLVVGPFYLSRGLGLHAMAVGAVLSVGPLVAAGMGVPAGRVADRLGARRVVIVGLAVMGVGLGGLSVVPTRFGVVGYVVPVVVVTVGYALFQTANNAAVMADVGAGRRGVVSGLLNLSRNLGLVTGAAVMGAVFAAASGGGELTSARPEGVVGGMRVTFGVATGLVVVAMGVAGAKQKSPRDIPGGSEGPKTIGPDPLDGKIRNPKHEIRNVKRGGGG